MLAGVLPAVLFCVLAVQAVPQLHTRQSITALSTAQIESFLPYTWYASTGYCKPSATLTWSCGANCEANPSFEPVASGGDGSVTQYWFVGYDPTVKTVIVSHQGTDIQDILPLVTDANIVLEPLSSTLFPGVSSSIEVHSGFASSQANSASDVLSAVQTTMAKYDTTTVTVVGHSLGAAIALLDFVYLSLHLPSGTTVKMFGYGLPRVGNQAFANYVDAQGGITHINNKEDFIPICPGMSLGFVQPSGEVHIEDSGTWASCPGQDNPSTQCVVGDVPTIFQGDESEHDGPYDGVEMGC